VHWAKAFGLSLFVHNSTHTHTACEKLNSMRGMPENTAPAAGNDRHVLQDGWPVVLETDGGRTVHSLQVRAMKA
jgi:hypothetical protein